MLRGESYLKQVEWSKEKTLIKMPTPINRQQAGLTDTKVLKNTPLHYNTPVW